MGYRLGVCGVWTPQNVLIPPFFPLTVLAKVRQGALRIGFVVFIKSRFGLISGVWAALLGLIC